MRNLGAWGLRGKDRKERERWRGGHCLCFLHPQETGDPLIPLRCLPHSLEGKFGKHDFLRLDLGYLSLGGGWETVMPGQGSSNPCSRGGWGDACPTLPALPSQLGAGWLLA